MPTCETEYLGEVHGMQELWQFPCAWAAVDGCHIPIKCPNKTKTQNENTKRKNKTKTQSENTKRKHKTKTLEQMLVTIFERTLAYCERL